MRTKRKWVIMIFDGNVQKILYEYRVASLVYHKGFINYVLFYRYFADNFLRT